MRCFVVPDGAPSTVQGTFSEIIAIHAALLPTGKIVYFAGEQHDPGQFANHLFDHARLFDTSTLAVSACTPAPEITDLFCSGHAFVEGGSLLIAGGTARFDGFQGAVQAWIYDPATNAFSATDSMSDGRWYPTLVTLGSGEVVALSGTNAAGTDQNRDIEVYAPSEGWTVEGIQSVAFDTLYPRTHLLPDGTLFFATPMGGECMTWTLGDPAPTPLCNGPAEVSGFAGHTTALLPLLPEEGFTARVLVANGAQPQIIDFSADEPAWSNTGARSVPKSGTLTSTHPLRQNGVLTILPTGEILSSGGEEAYGDEDHPVLPLEIYRPATNSWLTLPIGTAVTRAYHSTALLMPDGRVWFAGSNKRCHWSFHDNEDYVGEPEPTTPQEGSVDNRELRIEIFEPWYFGRPDRPAFSLTPSSVSVGRSITITCSHAATISRVALVRAGSSTHAFNPDQRFVGLPFTVSGTKITAHIPDNQDLVPPGPYLVFVLNQVIDPATGATLDVPSLGQWVAITNGKGTKELKAEVEVLKEEFGHSKENETFDPAGLLERIAVSVDNLARATAAAGAKARSFIRSNERPRLARVSAARLARVPIVPIAPDLLAKQIAMDGMMDTAGGGRMKGKRRGGSE